MNEKQVANFKLNLSLGEVKNTIEDEFVFNRRFDWKHISPELQEHINRITYALADAMKLSNDECKRGE
jgi:hypothetical protein